MIIQNKFLSFSIVLVIIINLFSSLVNFNIKTILSEDHMVLNSVYYDLDRSYCLDLKEFNSNLGNMACRHGEAWINAIPGVVMDPAGGRGWVSPSHPCMHAVQDPPSLTSHGDLAGSHDPWWRSPVTVTLSVADADCAAQGRIYFSVNGSPWEEYRRALTFSTEGRYDLRAYSVDNMGNASAILTKPIYLDWTPPRIERAELIASLDNDMVVRDRPELRFPVKDNLSGKDYVEVTCGGGKAERLYARDSYVEKRVGTFDCDYFAVDLAGNISPVANTGPITVLQNVSLIDGVSPSNLGVLDRNNQARPEDSNAGVRSLYVEKPATDLIVTPTPTRTPARSSVTLTPTPTRTAAISPTSKQRSLPASMCSIDQWEVDYFSNDRLQGLPTFSRCENGPSIDHAWAYSAPLPGLPDDSFSVQWRGRFNFAQAGTYRFESLANDSMQVYIDGSLLIDNRRGDTNSTPVSAISDINLKDGVHEIRVLYYEREGSAVARLQWAKTEGASDVPIRAQLHTLTPTRSVTPAPSGTTFELLPAQATVELETTFDVAIQVNASSNQPVNAAQAFLNFDPAKLQVISITDGTTLPIPVIKTVDNGIGEIGYAALTVDASQIDSFTLATVHFRAMGMTSKNGTTVVFNLASPSKTIAYGDMYPQLTSTTNSMIQVKEPFSHSLVPGFPTTTPPTHLGKIAYQCRRPSDTGVMDQICLVNPDGSGNQQVTQVAAYPDGASPPHITTALLDSPGADIVGSIYPRWSPDSAMIVYSSSRQGAWILDVPVVDGSNPVQMASRLTTQWSSWGGESSTTLTHPMICGKSADQVVLFADLYDTGRCRTLGIGLYPNPGTMDFTNDALTAAWAGSNAKVILCEHDNFVWACQTFTRNVANLVDTTIGNDRVSSVRVELRRGFASSPPLAIRVWLSGYESESNLQSASTLGNEQSIAAPLPDDLPAVILVSIVRNIFMEPAPQEKLIFQYISLAYPIERLINEIKHILISSLDNFKYIPTDNVQFNKNKTNRQTYALPLHQNNWGYVNLSVLFILLIIILLIRRLQHIHSLFSSIEDSDASCDELIPYFAIYLICLFYSNATIEECLFDIRADFSEAWVANREHRWRWFFGELALTLRGLPQAWYMESQLARRNR